MSPTARPKNDNFLRALLRQPVEYTPVWLMRQAGRYLPEYNETRRRAGSFLQLCKNPQMACEVTLQPLSRFELDAAILFSDILTVPDAMGLGLYFAEGEGPQVRASPCARNGRSATSPHRIPMCTCATSWMPCPKFAVPCTGSVPLIGFSGSPWTLACYMVEGGSGAATDYRTVKTMLYDRPDLLHHILGVTATAVTDYLNAQIESGAQAVMIFDSWGGVLSHAAYREFSLAYMQCILAGLKRSHDGRARAQYRLHQGRWAVAGGDCRHRLRCGGPGLDHRPRRSAPACR
jgi:uroporphyrinogen decarboxylase